MASVRAQSEPPAQIVVVIDHNPALERLARRAFPLALVVSNPHRAGVSGARNAGIARALGDIVVFLDDDAVADRDWLSMLCAAYAGDDVVGVGGSVAPAWESAPPAWFPEEFNWVVGCSYRGLPSAIASVRNSIGANMSFRRQVFEEVGLFDESFGRLGMGPTGCDETEFCLRVTKTLRGVEIRYAPNARVHHHVPADRADWSYFVARCRGEGYSKAMVTRAAGPAGTSSERRYVLTTLPPGVGRALRAFLLGRDRSGGRRAGAIAVGLAVTTGAYLQARLLARLSAPAPTPP